MSHSQRSLYHNKKSLFTFDEPCKFYGSARGCRHGSYCYYNHNNPSSVPLCRSYYIKSSCVFGDKCNYRHVAKGPSALIPKSDELCKYFNSPHGCSRKEKCRFQHIKQKQPEPDTVVRLYSMKQLEEMNLKLPQRTWRNKTETPLDPESDHITISQFNCLAQSLCYGGAEHNTFKCDKRYLVWEHRCKRLLYEIIQYKTDIICLTEIDKVHFDSFYHPNLQPLQYKGIFLLKNCDNKESHVSIQDGLAIFWNTNKIQYTDNKFECVLDDMRKCAHVAMGIRLKLKSNNFTFDVWNTHLKAGRSNESEHKRMRQCQILTKCMRESSQQTPIILCGDLNFHFADYTNEKDEFVRAKAYQLLTNGAVEGWNGNYGTDRNTLIFKSIWNDDECNTFSVYSGWKDGDVMACFDYIMIHSKNDVFEVKQVLNGWQQNEIEQFESKLPNKRYPSDHVLIAAKIALRTDETSKNKET